MELRSVRVLDCGGNGAESSVIAGMDWVALHAAKPAVANISLGGSIRIPAEDEAVTRLAQTGVYVVTAAGNEKVDACKESPGGAPGTMTVAASDKRDRHAAFGNFGPCVEVYAPSVAIKTDGRGGRPQVVDGMSFSAPFVSGVAALGKSADGDADQATVADWIVHNATRDVLRGVPNNTPNLLLYTGGL